MEVITTASRPSVHGFQFGNGFEHQVLGDTRTFGLSNGIAHSSCDFFFANRRPRKTEIVNYNIRPRSGVSATSLAAGHVDLFAPARRRSPSPRARCGAARSSAPTTRRSRRRETTDVRDAPVRVGTQGEAMTRNVRSDR